MPCSRTTSIIPTGTTLSTTTPRRRSASGSVSCESWRRPASRWWPLTCRSRTGGWRSPATSFAGYRPSGSTDRSLGEGQTPHLTGVETLAPVGAAWFGPQLLARSTAACFVAAASLEYIPDVLLDIVDPHLEQAGGGETGALTGLAKVLSEAPREDVLRPVVEQQVVVAGVWSRHV